MFPNSLFKTLVLVSLVVFITPSRGFPSPAEQLQACGDAFYYPSKVLCLP